MKKVSNCMYSWVDYIVNVDGSILDRYRLLSHNEELRLDGVSKLTGKVVGGVDTCKDTNNIPIYFAFAGEDQHEFYDSESAFEWVQNQVSIVQKAA